MLVYLYSRFLSGGAIVSLGKFGWPKVIEDSRCHLHVKVFGDTESYEYATFSALGSSVQIANKTWFAEECFINTLSRIMKRFSSPGDGISIGEKLAKHMDCSGNENPAIAGILERLIHKGFNISPLPISSRCAAELINRLFFLRRPNLFRLVGSCGVDGEPEDDSTPSALRQLALRKYQNIELTLKQRCLMVMLYLLEEDELDMSC